MIGLFLVLWREMTTATAIRTMLTVLLPMIGAVYAVFALKARFFPDRRYGWFVGTALGTVLGFALLSYGLEIHLLGARLTSSFAQTALNLTSISALALGLQYAKRGIVGQYQLQELRARNAEIELRALQTQLNPHFLFNTLNNICGINQLDSNRGTDMLMELADVLRFHLRFSENDRIALRDELDLIRAYLALEQLRLTDRFTLTLELPDPPPALRLPPLLLFPFVENALKHGTLARADCFVRIALRYDGTTLDFTVENSVLPNHRTVRTGIGQRNTRRRLELTYPDRHTLELTPGPDVYRAHLTLRP